MVLHGRIWPLKIRFSANKPEKRGSSQILTGGVSGKALSSEQERIQK
jgi:hypothetical protein